MGIKSILSLASVVFAVSVGGAFADSQTTENTGDRFSTVQTLNAVPLTAQEMDQTRGADNLWIWRNGNMTMKGGHPGFGDASTNWIVGCGGAPRSTIFLAPGC